MAWFEPMEMLATAWISAAAGAVTRAIGEARSAAVTAAARGQPAREVLCLQTATRFGDTTTVTRLGELVRVVGGARAPVAAQHAAALAAGDGDGLMTASAAYEIPSILWRRSTQQLRQPSRSDTRTGGDPHWGRRTGRANWPAAAAMSTLPR
jgi:hypothetical protein